MHVMHIYIYSYIYACLYVTPKNKKINNMIKFKVHKYAFSHLIITYMSQPPIMNCDHHVIFLFGGGNFFNIYFAFESF